MRDRAVDLIMNSTSHAGYMTPLDHQLPTPEQTPAQYPAQFPRAWNHLPPSPTTPLDKQSRSSHSRPCSMSASLAQSPQFGPESFNLSSSSFEASIVLDHILGAIFVGDGHLLEAMGIGLTEHEITSGRQIINHYSWQEANLLSVIDSIERIKRLPSLQPFHGLQMLRASLDTRILRFLNSMDHSAGVVMKSQSHGLEHRLVLLASRPYAKGQMVGECVADLAEITPEARFILRQNHCPALYHTVLGRDYCITGGPLSLVTHDCLANCEIVVDPAGVASLRTSRAVNANEVLTASNAGLNLPCSCATCLFPLSSTSSCSTSGAESANPGLGISISREEHLPFAMDSANILTNWNAFNSTLPQTPLFMDPDGGSSPLDTWDVASEDMHLPRSSSLSTNGSAMTSPTRASFGEASPLILSRSSSSSHLNKYFNPIKRPNISPLSSLKQRDPPMSSSGPDSCNRSSSNHLRSASTPYLHVSAEGSSTSQSAPDNLSNLEIAARKVSSRQHNRRSTSDSPIKGRKRKSLIEPTSGILIHERALFERLLTILRLAPDAPNAHEHGQLLQEFCLLKTCLGQALTQLSPPKIKSEQPVQDSRHVNSLRFPAFDLGKRAQWLASGPGLTDGIHAEQRVSAGISFYLDWQLAGYHDALASAHDATSGRPLYGNHDLHRKIIADYNEVRLAHPELRLKEVRGWDEMRRRLHVARRMVKLTDILGRALLIAGLVSRRMLEQASDAEFGLLLHVVEPHKDAFTWLVLESTKNHEDVIAGLAILDKLFLIRSYAI